MSCLSSTPISLSLGGCEQLLDRFVEAIRIECSERLFNCLRHLCSSLADLAGLLKAGLRLVPCFGDRFAGKKEIYGDPATMRRP